MLRMPPTRDDRRLLVFTGVFVLIAGVLFALVILLATGQQDAPDPSRPFFIGLERQKKEAIREESPQYIANPNPDGEGFWLDLEDGELVALVLHRSDAPRCFVKWKEQQEGYVDCDGNVLSSRQLERYVLIVGARNGSPRGSVYVDLRKKLPAPEPL
jgi:hypothetical protein